MLEGGSNEIIFIFNGELDKDKEVLAYASIFSDRIRKFDIRKAKLNRAFFIDLGAKLALPYHDLLDHDSKIISSHEYFFHFTDQNQYIDLLVKHPELLKTPILVFEDRAIRINDKADIMQVSFL